MEERHHRLPDGTLVYEKAWESGREAGLLIIPDIGQTVLHPYFDRLGEHLSTHMDVVLLELRGHRLSQGKWSLPQYRRDIAHWIVKYRSFKRFYVLALGFSATTLLEYDDQAHTFRGPPVPDGMVLINPAFSGSDVLPDGIFRRRAVMKHLAKHKVSVEDVGMLIRSMDAYVFNPVRIQTPSVVFVAGDVLGEPLQKIFGSVDLRTQRWLHHGTQAEVAKHLKEVESAVKMLLSGERPHRFRAGR